MDILLGLAVLIFSAILHEVAHGYVADQLGDPTARLSGRLTLNPIPHIDPFMSIVFPLLLIFTNSPIIFGAAKPVPIDPFNFREKRKDTALVALAGPLTNIILAVTGALLFHILDAIPFLFPAIVGVFLHLVIIYNLLLAILNILPIPPLDGSKVLAFFLPEKEANIYLGLGSIGIFILLLLLVVPIGPFSLRDLMQTLLTVSLNVLGVPGI